MAEGSGVPRIPRRQLFRLGAGALAAAPLLRGLPRSQAQPAPVTLARDIVHAAPQLALGDTRGLQWAAPRGRPALEAASARAQYVSPVVRTPFPFSHVGIHWSAAAESVSDVRFQARTSPDRSEWSPWRDVVLEAAPGDARGRDAYGALLAADGGRYVQYRVSFDPEAERPPALERVTVTAINAQQGPTTTTPVAPGTIAAAVAGAPPLPFFSREQWGADERLRFTPDGETWLRMYVPVKKVVVHHTATLEAGDKPTPQYTPDQALAEVRAIYYYHAITLGWGDIGYNALVDRFGRVYEGRYGRDGPPREVVSPQLVAGHTKNFNHGSDGFSCIGNFDVNDLGPQETGTMVPALLALLEWDLRRHYIHPADPATFLRFDNYWVSGIPNLCGHRDCNTTACPGRFLYQRLAGWRQQLLQRLTGAGGLPSVSLSGPDGVTVGVPVSFSFAGDNASQFAWYLEAWAGDQPTGNIWPVAGYTQDMRPAWGGFSSLAGAAFPDLYNVRYTMHVRARNPAAEGPFEANHTFIVDHGAPPAPQALFRLGAPGLARN